MYLCDFKKIILFHSPVAEFVNRGFMDLFGPQIHNIILHDESANSMDESLRANYINNTENYSGIAQGPTCSKVVI